MSPHKNHACFAGLMKLFFHNQLTLKLILPDCRRLLAATTATSFPDLAERRICQSEGTESTRRLRRPRCRRLVRSLRNSCRSPGTRRCTGKPGWGHNLDGNVKVTSETYLLLMLNSISVKKLLSYFGQISQNFVTHSPFPHNPSQEPFRPPLSQTCS